MNKAKIIGWLFGLSVFIFSICIKPEATCNDGWKSPSIGRQGACSHHGGVDYNSEYPLIGLIVGFFLYFLLNVKEEKKFISQSESKLKLNVETAINTGRKITFLYKKPKDKTYHLRTIKPIKFVKFQHTYGNNFTFCVNGICDLRKSERNFALKRMKDLKMV